MVPQESRDAVRRSLRAEESCSLHFALVAAAGPSPASPADSAVSAGQQHSTSVDFHNWTRESSKGRVQSPASSGVPAVSLVLQRTRQGCGSQPATFAYDPSSPGRCFLF